MDIFVALFLITSGPCIMLGIYLGLVWADLETTTSKETI